MIDFYKLYRAYKVDGDKRTEYLYRIGDDVLHCENGPAAKHHDGTVEYWLHGERVTPEDHAARTGTKQEPRRIDNTADKLKARLDIFAASLTVLAGKMPVGEAAKVAGEIARATVPELDK